MSAKNYKLCVSALTGTVYISKVSKKNPNEMTDDRVEVPASDFIRSMVEWIDSREKENGVLIITAGGKPILRIEQLKKTTE